MATALQFRTEAAANQILKSGKAKIEWAIIDPDKWPADIVEQVRAMQNYDMLYRQTKAIVEAMLADKAVVPAGKRVVVTAGRQASPDQPAPILYGMGDASNTVATPVGSFDQFISKYT